MRFARHFSSTFNPRKTNPFFSREVVGGMSLLGVVSGCAGLYQLTASRAATKAAHSLPHYEGNPLVFLDVYDGDEEVGRVIVQLRADAAPKASENFRALCVGAMGWGYKGSPLHAVEKGRRLFGGDFFGSGQSGFSIYGDTFEDEAGGLALVHGGPGVVGMRNWGPDTNNSQFYITQGRLPELDGRCVVVGNVMEGWEVLAWLDKCAAVSGGRFGKGHNFRIKHSGELGKEYVLEGKPRVKAPTPTTAQPPSTQQSSAQP